MLSSSGHCKQIHVLWQGTDVPWKPPTELSQLGCTLTSFFFTSNAALFFMEISALLKIPAHTKKGTLILVPSISETQNISTSPVLLNKTKH